MTDGDKERTLPWIKELEVEYAFGYDHTFPWVFAYNVWTYPYCLLVAPSGAVVWGGHPEKLDERILRKHLEAAIKKPLFAWPKELAEVRAAIRERKFKVALERVSAVAERRPELASYVADVRKLIRNRVAGLNAALKAGDYATVLDIGDRVQSELQDLPEEDEAAKLTNAVFDDDDAILIWNAQAKLRRLRSRQPRTRKEADELTQLVQALMKEHPGTAVEKEGRMAVGVYKKIRGFLK